MSQNNSIQYFGNDLEAMCFARNYHNWIIDELSPYIGSSVAEVGGGTGSLSSIILNMNISKLTVFEPSLNMFQILRNNLASYHNVELINGCMLATASECYDSVMYINVLEHIEDHASELSKAYDVLKKGGYLLIFAPALEWLYSGFDKKVGHFRRYTKKGLLAITQNSGFSVIKIRYFDLVGIIPWYINFVLLNNSMNGGNVALYDKLAVPIIRIVEKIIVPPLGKNLLLVARK